jgi:hypothetical protein
VFSGQNHDHDSMIPTGLRTQAHTPLRRIWQVYSHYVAEDIWRSLPEQIGLPDLSDDLDKILSPRKGIPQDQKWDVFEIWLEAIAQHYGPGSKFLDVTYFRNSCLVRYPCLYEC